MSVGAGSGIVDFFHGFQVALMMTVMFNLTQFIYWRCAASRNGTCWNKYQPVLWTFIATILVNVQPIMILTFGSFKLCCAECATVGVKEGCPANGMSYPPWGNGIPRPCDVRRGGNTFWDKSYCDGSKLAMFPVKWEGWCVQIFCTYGGFVFMLVGILQATQLHVKFVKQWRAIRSGRR